MSQLIGAALLGVIERADQLVLNYVSAAADAAHGVLRTDQRLDFSKRLRARIEAERGGSQNAREVARVLARFGDPAVLVEREVRRLAEAGLPTRREPAPTAGREPAEARRAAGGAVPGTVSGPAPTLRFPAIVDDRETPPGVRAGRDPAQGRRGGRDPLQDRLGGRDPLQDRLTGRDPGRDGLGGRRAYGMPFARLRRAAMFTANPMATGGRDARTVVKEHPREIAAMVILVLAALLVPFGLPAVAIFRVPVLVWGLGAVMVLFGETWTLRDKLVGIGAPLLGYTLGGVLVGGLRAGEPGLQAFFTQFFDVSGTTFMIGTALGVVWLGYQLLDVS
jgi:hypothetical protein